MIEDLKEFVNSNEMKVRTELCEIMREFGSDKCSDWHNYTPVYHKLFSHMKEAHINFFELGIFLGASVRGWRRYFKNASIFAADVDSSFLINDEGISSYLCDQDSDHSISEFCKNFDESFSGFDIMIEDGKHEYFSNYNFLVNSFHLLKSGGIYVIEDLTSDTWHRFQAVESELKNFLKAESFCMLDIPNFHNGIDNRLIIIKK